MEAFLDVPPDSDFSIDNLPYGAYKRARSGGSDGGDGAAAPRLCVALGDHVVDLAALQAAGLFAGPVLSRHPDVFQQARGGSGAGPLTLAQRRRGRYRSGAPRPVRRAPPHRPDPLPCACADSPR
jgi:hypothetical protein